MSFFKNDKNEVFVFTPDNIHLAKGLISISDTEAMAITNPITTQPTAKELKAIKLKQFEQAVQSHLDITAQSKGYDSILSACTYAGYVNPFQTEGQAFTEWRGNVWAYCYEQVDIFTGTVEEFILTLPKFEG